MLERLGWVQKRIEIACSFLALRSAVNFLDAEADIPQRAAYCPAQNIQIVLPETHLSAVDALRQPVFVHPYPGKVVDTARRRSLLGRRLFTKRCARTGAQRTVALTKPRLMALSAAIVRSTMIYALMTGVLQ